MKTSSTAGTGPSTMTSGAMTVPSEPPAVQRLLAVARWRFSNQSVTATICPAKIVGSASPEDAAADGEFDDVGRKAAADGRANDHATIPPSITFFDPKRSTRMPIWDT